MKKEMIKRIAKGLVDNYGVDSEEWADCLLNSIEDQESITINQATRKLIINEILIINK